MLIGLIWLIFVRFPCCVWCPKNWASWNTAGHRKVRRQRWYLYRSARNTLQATIGNESEGTELRCAGFAMKRRSLGLFQHLISFKFLSLRVGKYFTTLNSSREQSSGDDGQAFPSLLTLSWHENRNTHWPLASLMNLSGACVPNQATCRARAEHPILSLSQIHCWQFEDCPR